MPNSRRIKALLHTTIVSLCFTLHWNLTTASLNKGWVPRIQWGVQGLQLVAGQWAPRPNTTPTANNPCKPAISLRSCPLRIIPLCLSWEEGMIHFFVRSHVKKPEYGLFSDWIGNNTDDLRCSNWPKCRHPLVVVDFSLHFCLRHEQWMHTRVRYKISAGSVFLNLKNA